MEADVKEGATALPLHTSAGTIRIRATAAELMYQAGTPVPRARGNVKGTHAGMQKHMAAGHNPSKVASHKKYLLQPGTSH